MFFAWERDLAHYYFLYENESLQHGLLYKLKQMTTLLVLEARFFQRVHFLSGPFFLKSRFWVRVWFLDDAY